MTSSQSRRLPLQQQVNNATVNRIAEGLFAKGLQVPCKIKEVGTGYVKAIPLVNEISSLVLTVPTGQSLYSQAPLQVNDFGVLISLDASVAQVTGLSSSVQSLKSTGNLGSLVFLPISSTQWAAMPDKDMYLIQGPKGFLLRSLDGTVAVTGTKGKSLVFTYGKNNFTLDSSGAKLNCSLTVDGDIKSTGTVSGATDVQCESISLKSHLHNVTAVGSPTSTPIP